MEKSTKQTTSAGGIVVNKNGLILIINHRGKSWGFPKGHIEGTEGVLDAATREIYEESGINQLTFISNLGNYQRYRMTDDYTDDTTEHKTIHMFLFKTDQLSLRPINDHEILGARWVEKGEVTKTLTHRKDKEFFVSIINKIDQ